MASIKDKTTELAIKSALSYVEKNPDRNILKIIDLLDKVDINHNYKKQ